MALMFGNLQNANLISEFAGARLVSVDAIMPAGIDPNWFISAEFPIGHHDEI